MTHDADRTAKKLLRRQQRETSGLFRFGRRIAFSLGFSKCKHCIYCNFEGEKYRGMRESVMLPDGVCHWSKESASSRLSYEDLNSYHRCPAFRPVLYNFKKYGIDPTQIEKITERRRILITTWAGWFVAVLVAVVNSWLRTKTCG